MQCSLRLRGRLDSVLKDFSKTFKQSITRTCYIYYSLSNANIEEGDGCLTSNRVGFRRVKMKFVLNFLCLPVCESIDIRNNLGEFQKLAECTVVEGYLKIVLMNDIPSENFRHLSFPKLREVTDTLILFKVDGLQSLSQLFPNLALIRGQNLIHNYALIIFELSSLENVGLTKLMRIARGGVRYVL